MFQLCYIIKKAEIHHLPTMYLDGLGKAHEMIPRLEGE